MKRIYLIFLGVVMVLILLNVFYYFDLKKQQIIFQKKYINEQAISAVSRLEKTEMQLENDFNAFLFSNDLATLTSQEAKSNELSQKVEVLYTKYPDLIANISFYDQNKNVFSLYRDSKENFILDKFTTHNQQEITDKEYITLDNHNYHFIFPVFKEKQLFGNLDITIDPNAYFESQFQGYAIKNMQWQWILDKNGKKIFSNEFQKVENFNIQEIHSGLNKNLRGYILHNVTVKGQQLTVLSTYFPAKFLKNDLGIIFSVNLTDIFVQIQKKAGIVIMISILIILIVFLLLRNALLKISKQEKIHQKAEKNLIQIFDSIPIGVLIITQEKVIRHINRTASDILYGKEEKNLIGRNITDMILPKFFSEKSSGESAFDTNHFYYFEKDGNEIVIYKKDIPFELDNEQLIIEAFIDISPIEKARKLEAAANLAKSDFLAKMSHEIRTPLNGIVGMADALLQQKLSTEQHDFAEIIKKSSDLLLTIINDVLDYSKIEAGKMVLEEIPFKISDEIDFARELFKPIAEDKKLRIITQIASNVPNHVIGDPFRLRQVISNLLSNAIKFTHEGEVSISVELLEEYGGNITLQFNVEDTGIGIPKDKLDSIFASYTQADGSTTRKYGGSGLGTTISKQLVELMSGEIWVESPSTISTSSESPGTRFSFTIEAYSNERIQKNYDFAHITNYEDIQSLVITDNNADGEPIYNYLSNFGTNCEVYVYHQETPELLVNKLLIEYQKFHMVFIKDSLDLDGYKIAKTLFEKGITFKHMFVMLSSNDNVGNYIRARRLGIDYYLIKPYESSEIFDIIQDNFTTIRSDLRITPKLNKIRKNISILVAEDNLINQKVAKTIFKNLGYEISIAKNGVEAVEMALKDNHDIIFMDMMMPEKDGVQATKDLRKKGYTHPIIAMTANATKEGKNKAISFGMDGYVTKPTKMEAIKKILIKYFSEVISEV